MLKIDYLSPVGSTSSSSSSSNSFSTQQTVDSQGI